MIRTSLLAAAATLALVGGAAAQTLPGTFATQVVILDGPGPNYAVVREFPAQAQLTVEGCNADGTWCRVSADGATGWVQADSVQVTADGRTFVLSGRPSTVMVETIPGSDTVVMHGAAGSVAVTPTDAETAYTLQNPIPPIVYSGELRVGTVLPETVVLTPVPQSQLTYAYVGDVPVLVGPGRQVVWFRTN